MNPPSRYLQYLPPVLWQTQAQKGGLSLAELLPIFEALLTGRSDSGPIGHGEHTHRSVEETINTLHALLDVWKTTPDFLQYLAEWLALRFPEQWNEYQRRKITGEIVDIYSRRGLRAGLNQFLALYTIDSLRPRIAIDDCSKVLWTRPEPGTQVPIQTLLSQLPLIMPQCMVLAPDGTLLIADAGPPDDGKVYAKAIYRVHQDGSYALTGAPPAPTPISPSSLNLEFPMAMAVDDSTPFVLYILDRRGSAHKLYRLSSPLFDKETLVADLTTLIRPVGMVFRPSSTDPKLSRLLILDRGANEKLDPKPLILEIDLNTTPPTTTNHALAAAVVREPVSFALQQNGMLLIGSAPLEAEPDGNSAGITSVDAAWKATPLLDGVPGVSNPLIAPNAIAARDNQFIYVVDTGLRPFWTQQVIADPFIRKVAVPAAVYSIDLSTTPPSIVPATEKDQLVSPTAAVLSNGNLFVSDRGEYASASLVGQQRVWRNRQHEFGIVIHFKKGVPQPERRRIVQSIRDVVEREKPAHTSCFIVFGDSK